MICSGAISGIEGGEADTGVKVQTPASGIGTTKAELDTTDSISISELKTTDNESKCTLPCWR